MSARPRIAVLFHRLGPYHLARLAAAGARCDLTAIELSAVDRTYAWAPVSGAPNFARVTLFADEDVDLKPRGLVGRTVRDSLAAADPGAVAVPGWSHPSALAALLWCVRNGRPAVLMSESAMHDERRRPAREAAKRRIVRLFGSALVGGAPHREYACALGLPAPAVVAGYDVVDNAHFARRAREASASDQGSRRRLGLPARFFLASARFVAGKNLLFLLDAYADYRRHVGAEAWRLVLLGDGPLRAEVESRIAGLGLTGEVLLPGFRQYHELPAFYGLAGAFVHASATEPWGLVVNEAMAAGLPVLVSERCGCARDLVRDGVNGFTFDPWDVAQLAGMMHRIAAMTDAQRDAMAAAGRGIIAEWGPERFADGLMRAAELAVSRPRPQASVFDQTLLRALARVPL
jgi:1,2-diacylglycerol 3-alpha-glucosyltransferase